MESQIQTVLSNAHYVRYSFAYFLRSQEQLGLKRFSLYGSTPHLFIDHRDFSEVEALACLLAQKGFSISAFLPANYGYSLFAQQETEHFAVSLEYYKTVSYTHLDVYKRQSPDRPGDRPSERRSLRTRE